jgi:hypothetical protein
VSEELTAAVGRLRGIEGPTFHGVGGKRHISEREYADAVTLAMAWLNEHPADDAEPVTLEWALTQGSREPNNVDISAPPTVIIPGCRHGVLVQATRREWHWCSGSKVIATLRTRGDYRRLCAVFGALDGEQPREGGGQ